jgi:dynein heavy chain
METIPQHRIPSNISFTDIVVPTIDNVRHSYLLDILIRAGYYFFCTEPTGTAKSITVNKFMMNELDPSAYIPISFTFSSRTNANQTQDIIDPKFERRQKGVFGPLDRKKAIVFFADTNMPAKEVYGAQPSIELLRQWIDHGGWYDRKLLEFHRLVDSQLICACGHPGGGRQELTPRFMRHFNIFNFVEMEDLSLAHIFKVIIENHLSTFDALIQDTGKEIIAGTIAI